MLGLAILALLTLGFTLVITFTVLVAGHDSDALKRIFGDVMWPVYVSAIGIVFLVTTYIVKVAMWVNRFSKSGDDHA